MKTLTITVDREDQLEDATERVLELLRQGFTSGIEPSWDISGEDEPSDDEDDEDLDAGVGECWNCGAEYEEVWSGEPPAPPRKCLDCGEMEKSPHGTPT